MAINGPSNPLQAGGKYSLTCNVTSDLPPTVKWLDPDDNAVDNSDSSVIVSQPVTLGNTTTLVLKFDPLKASHGGSYSCVSTVAKPSSFKRMRRHLEVQCKSGSALKLVLFKLTQAFQKFGED